MPRSDDSAGLGPADLLSDIGRSSTVTPEIDVHEQRLMRVSRDPLAVREFLLREGDTVLEPQAVPLLTGEAAISLARSRLIESGAVERNWRQGDMHYLRHEVFSEANQQTSAFAPSCEDREEALELHPQGSEGSHASGRALLRLTALCVSALLFLVLIRLRVP